MRVVILALLGSVATINAAEDGGGGGDSGGNRRMNALSTPTRKVSIIQVCYYRTRLP